MFARAVLTRAIRLPARAHRRVPTAVRAMSSEEEAARRAAAAR